MDERKRWSRPYLQKGGPERQETYNMPHSISTQFHAFEATTKVSTVHCAVTAQVSSKVLLLGLGHSLLSDQYSLSELTLQSTDPSTALSQCQHRLLAGTDRTLRYAIVSIP